MDASDRETIQGRLLDHWLDDLRQDRAPTLLPEMAALSAEERAEVLDLARWYASALFLRADPPEAYIETLALQMRDTVLNERTTEAHAVEQLIENVPTFGLLVREARTLLDMNAQSLEQALKLPHGTVHRLEVGELPPHRMPVEVMAPLLHGLRLESSQVVNLLQRTSASWAEASFSEAQTQLGRTDAAVTGEDRRDLLRDGNDDASRLEQELLKIEQYCRELAHRLT